ncbi:DMT family transporter [Bermanella sp. WJH001]|uniref:DMT family transporter n=1 Tax=Bermanella sp. WJH001 TaxID=3048005 RepID=UPI0024BE3382|nr:DMT family transporter [Bermanella sp. WJH001]MDJ1536686.1 DMT family transporter [Bermanella sp. WJH001]
MTFITPRIAFFLLLLTSFIWGMEFVLVDLAIEIIPTHTFNALRFAVAALSLIPLFYFSKETVDHSQMKTIVLAGLFLGLLLFVAFYTQTEGMRFTSVSNAGFITGLCVPLVSFLGFIFFKQKASLAVWIGITLATIGLYCLTVGDKFVFNKGDALVLVCAFCFAFHILLTGKFVDTMPVIFLSIIQLAAVAMYSAIAGYLDPSPSFYFTGNAELAWYQQLTTPIVYAGILIAGILGTAYAYWAQSVSQTLLEPHKVALIFASEPIFAHISAWFFLDEHLGLLGIVGAACIIIGMLVSELGDKQHTPKVNVLDQNSSL